MSVFSKSILLIGTTIALGASTAAVATPLCADGGYGPGDYACLYDGLKGNTNDNTANVQAAILAATSNAVILTQYGKSDANGALFTFTNATFSGGEWDFSSPDTNFSILDDALAATYITVKAANDFILFHYEDGISAGSLVTDIVNNGGKIADISHVTFWNMVSNDPGPSNSVPAPGALGLLLLGVGGLVAARRKA
ncbi:PEP-CTERM sorting domain-containing protein [Pacificimonas sp. WHA3]|uniref:PEP-CTERM sorting domain-containing protein n=1 Tax=Pacificimonas pallii TaxID=2827236 RepID=A0ABS6SDP3_9SPHN|nr:PEP-CTERM sorting domain-containing protein [Pacificimonas pallii]MBV7256535.1 PEP-CTERM sorting domain-containing protein [Pacificimonas pallii]